MSFVGKKIKRGREKSGKCKKMKKGEKRKK
jgi:hypothetical protein